MASSTEKLSFRDVVVRCDTSIKQHFDMTLLPQLEASKIIPKGLQAKIEANPNILISCLKTTKNFIQLLPILERHARQSEETRKLMGIMSSHVKNMITEGPEAESIIRSFLDMVERYNTKQSQTATAEGRGGVTTETETEQGSDVSLPLLPCPSPPSPPPMEGCVSDYFGQEGGVLYSPIHGIRITMPPNSLPPHIAQCFLSIFVYSSGPFTLPDGVESCSPVVWIKLHPQFTFEKDVTLIIPHSALLSTDSELSVYRMAADVKDKRSPPYHLSEKVPGSECDWYHVVVRVRHFSPHEVGAEKKKKSTSGEKCLHKAQQPSLKHKSKHGVGTPLKQFSQHGSRYEKSGPVSDELTVVGRPQLSRPLGSHKTTNPSVAISTNAAEEPALFVSTQSEYRSVNSYCIIRCMPKDRSCTPWEAKFYVAQDHPTALWGLPQPGNNCECSSPKRFCFTQDRLQFICQEVSEGWDVYPTEGEEITIADLQWSEAVNRKVYLTYHVDVVGGENPSPLKSVINISGANRPLKYTLTSTQPSKDHTSASLLTTPHYLYDKGGAVVQHLSSEDTKSLCLDTQHEDHLRLITDISLQLPCPEKLAKILDINVIQYERMKCQSTSCAEQIFHLLWSWVCKKSEQKDRMLTVHDLCTALEVNRIVLSMPEADEDCPYINPEYNGECVQLQDDHLLKIVNTLHACWKFVGRFLAVPEHHLTEITESSLARGPQQSCEPAHEMIRRWHSLKGREANYGTLFRAIHRLWEFDSMRANCNDTFCVVGKYLDLSSSSVVFSNM